jgi:hypothetical protein
VETHARSLPANASTVINALASTTSHYVEVVHNFAVGWKRPYHTYIRRGKNVPTHQSPQKSQSCALNFPILECDWHRECNLTIVYQPQRPSLKAEPRGSASSLPIAHQQHQMDHIRAGRGNVHRDHHRQRRRALLLRENRPQSLRSFDFQA